MSPGIAIAVTVLLLIGNAFFVGAEFALISARRTQIEPRAENAPYYAEQRARFEDQYGKLVDQPLSGGRP